MIDEIYHEIILDHYKNPRNFGELENASLIIKDSNPLCGDVIEFHLKMTDGKIEDVKFHGEGCAISRAAASMITEKIKGMSKEEIQKLDRKFVLDLLQVELSPVRLKCALLPLSALKMGLK